MYWLFIIFITAVFIDVLNFYIDMLETVYILFKYLWTSIKIKSIDIDSIYLIY